MRVIRRRRSARGAVMVELAVAMPVLVLIVWGAIDFARAYYTANSLATAVREGGRYAAVIDSMTPAWSDSIKAKVKSSFLTFGGDTIPTASISVIDSAKFGGYRAVKVTNYQWNATTPLKIFTNGRILMTRRATFRWEREPTV